MKLQRLVQKIKYLFREYHKIIIPFLAVFIFLGGYWHGIKTEEKLFTEKTQKNPQIRQSGHYKFINPLIECELFNNGGITQSVKLEKITKSVAEKALEDPAISDISVYFRDLNNGPWFGYNEDTTFVPASLLKVPIMIAYLKEAQDNPSILNEKFIYQNMIPNDQTSQNVGPIQELKYGNKYSILQIIESMIIYSDNNAVNVLIKNRSEDFFDQINTDLMVPKPESPDLEENFMTVRQYASFFRILYNSSYLDRKMSEKALEILSKSNFKDGLVAELPKDTVVAHKFGIRTTDDLMQIHDCGIIYNSRAPYLLCIMTRGHDIKFQEKTIGKISKNIWDEFSK